MERSPLGRARSLRAHCSHPVDENVNRAESLDRRLRGGDDLLVAREVGGVRDELPLKAVGRRGGLREPSLRDVDGEDGGPSSSSRSTVARSIPEAPPVWTVRLPSNRFKMVLSWP